MDARLGWRFWRDWEIAVVGQNLLHDDHLESASAATGVQRGGVRPTQLALGSER
jgi:hypothetical protein